MRSLSRGLEAGAAAVALLCAIGCSDISPYTANRLSDLTDVAHVDITFFSLGFVVNVGPMLIGAETLIPNSDQGSHQYRMGFGGQQEVTVGYAADGLVVPFCRERVISRKYGCLVTTLDQMEDDYYWKHVPTWGSAGISAGLLVGLGVHVDVVELADLVLGFRGYDIVRDDLWATSMY
jgi:hypothetical protein